MQCQQFCQLPWQLVHTVYHNRSFPFLFPFNSINLNLELHALCVHSRFGHTIDSVEMTQGAITKRMTAIEEMAGMDVLCSDKTGTLTLNKLTVDKNLIEVSEQKGESNSSKEISCHFSA